MSRDNEPWTRVVTLLKIRLWMHGLVASSNVIV
jgi:hypothetical protein